MRILLTQLPEERVQIDRGEQVPAWYLSMLNINLPDCAKGHAVLVVEKGDMSLETHNME